VIDQAIDTVISVVSSNELTAARATAECHEEVPFALRASEFAIPHIVTGAIDLVHRHGDGWRVLDYKTDVDQGNAAQKYADQVRAYAAAWGKISGAATETAVILTRVPS
jgi:ATP-dependent exoDNAse (exonuclease V) beta subunit